MRFSIHQFVHTALLMAMPIAIHAADKSDTFINAADAGPDFKIQGEYEGRIGKETKLGAHVIALGDGKFDAVLYAKGLPGAGWDGKKEATKVPLKGETKDGVVQFTGTNFTGSIKNGVFSGKGEDDIAFDLPRVERQSPTLGAKPPEGAIVLFDGSNTDAWTGGKLQDGNLLAVGPSTKQKFRNFSLHLEFRSPFMPKARGQGRGNSGMYLLDQYECQILDSFGLSGENNECGGFYTLAKPAVNMCLPPLSWQTYDVDFTQATFDDAGKKIKGAIVTLRHNGVVIHDKLELPKNTPGGHSNDESQPGALFLQDHGNPVHFRNIWIVEKK